MTDHIIPLIILLAAMMILFLSMRFARRWKGSSPPLPLSPTGPVRPCPLCGSNLGSGETVRTTVFETQNPGESMVHMFGCPHCDTRTGRSNGSSRSPRYCPVCSATLDTTDHVIARLFERRERKHLHVLGCTRCRQSRNLLPLPYGRDTL